VTRDDLRRAWRELCERWGPITCGDMPATRLQRALIDRVTPTKTPADKLALPF